MVTLLSILIMVVLVLLIIGLASPALLAKLTRIEMGRGKVAGIYGIALLVLLYALGSIAPKATETEATKEQPQQAAKVDVAEAIGIPGLTASDVTLNLKDQRFKVDGPKTLSSGGIMYEATRKDGDSEFRVEVWGNTSSEITAIEATAFDYGAGVSAQASFLAYLATTPYDGAEPAKASEWVKANIGKAKQGQPVTTTIGGVKFELVGHPAKLLRLEPAN